MKNGKVIDEHGNIQYYKNNVLHRTDGPAVVLQQCITQKWYLNGRLHRIDGPAIKTITGEEWYLNGKRHRIGGPAWIKKSIYGQDGYLYQCWYVNDELHREDGPASELFYLNNLKAGGSNFYLRGNILSELEWQNILNKKIKLDIIEKTPDVKFRRMLIEYYGIGRYLEDTQTKPIYKSDLGEIYKKLHKDDEPLVAIKVKNSTPEEDGSYKDYFIRIPPYFGRRRFLVSKEKIIRDAIAWTFAMKGSEYDPKIET